MLARGTFHFLTGSSGAGKSSLLGLLYLAMHPTAGSVRLFGVDVGTEPRRKLPAVRRRIGVVFQEFRLLAHLSAFDNVRSEEHTSELQSLMRISYAVFCLKKKQSITERHSRLQILKL